MEAKERVEQRIVNQRLRNRVSRMKTQDELTEIKVEKPEESYYFAGFWMRLWAFLIDLITVFTLNLMIVSPLIKITALNHWSVETILTATVFFLYFAIMTKKFGQTIGKMVFGLKVIAKDNHELTWSQIIFREGIGRLIQQVFFVMYILYVTIAFTTKKQGLHDMIADTYVIHEHVNFHKPV